VRTELAIKRFYISEQLKNDLTWKLSGLLNLQWRQWNSTTIHRLICIVTRGTGGDIYRLCPIYLYFDKTCYPVPLCRHTGTVTWHTRVVYTLFYVQILLGSAKLDVLLTQIWLRKTTEINLIYTEIYVSGQADYSHVGVRVGIHRGYLPRKASIIIFLLLPLEYHQSMEHENRTYLLIIYVSKIRLTWVLAKSNPY
jgi:hypothetical protein